MIMRRRTLLIIGAAFALMIIVAVIILRVITASPAPSLDNVLWTLTDLEVNGQTHELVANVPVTLTFHTTNHTITGSSGCNSYQATYEQNNAQVQFRDFAMTLVGCLGAQGEQENLYLQALMHAETLHISGNVMTITGSGGKDILRFSSARQ
jgi:heat shock protein HslJ